MAATNISLKDWLLGWIVPNPNGTGTGSVGIQAVTLVDSAGTPTGGSPAAFSTATATQVAASATAVTILAANTARRGATFYYDAAAILYLLPGAGTPTASVYQIKMGSGLYTYYELPPGYTGIVKGIWSAATGSVDVVEYT